MAKLDVRNLGEYIREQRSSANVSLRQLAKLAGVSNPYLSQIERGLRKPSAEILQQLAKALRISAETLYVRAGLLDGGADVDEDAATEEHGVRAAVAGDPWLNARQKRALLDIYEAFRIESARDAAAASQAGDIADTGTDTNNDTDIEDEPTHGPVTPGPTEQ